MRNRIIVIVLLGIVMSCPRVWAQEVPGAVVADLPVENRWPPRLAMFTVPSQGADLDAWLYIAGGAPHGTVILAHGLPGGINGELAQSIRRAGWNVLLFHYRGT